MKYKTIYKKFPFIFLFFSLSFFCFGQTEQNLKKEQSEDNDKILTKIENFEKTKIKIPKNMFFFTLGPSVYVNTDRKTSPSPVSFAGGAGFDLFNHKFLNFQPKLTFFTNYYLWDGEYARPSEIENRTALALSFLLDLNTTHIFRLEKDIFQFGGGLGFLARFSFLANGVNSDDSGGGTNSTAGDDVKSINRWFYKNLNFLYPNLNFSWQRAFTKNYLAGLEAKIYFPLGAILDGRAFDTAIFSLGIKISPK